MDLFVERDAARWGREVRAWLAHDDRARTIGLVILSISISIAMSLLATAIVGFVSRRRAADPGDALPPDVGEPLAEVAAAAEGVGGIPVMDRVVPASADEPTQVAPA